MDSIAGVECNAADLILFTPSCVARRDHSKTWLAPQLEAIQKVQYLLGVGNATRPRPYLAVAVTLAVGLAVAALLFAIHQRGSAHDNEQLVPMRVLQSDAAGELPLAYTQLPYKV